MRLVSGSFSQFGVGSLFSYTHIKSHSLPCLFVVSMRRISHLIYIFDIVFNPLFSCIHVLKSRHIDPLKGLSHISSLMQRPPVLLLKVSETLGNVASAGSGLNCTETYTLSDSTENQSPIESPGVLVKPPISFRDGCGHYMAFTRIREPALLYAPPLSAHRNSIG